MKEKLNDSTTKLKLLKKRKRSTYLQFFFSVISLFIVMAVFITSSTAWFTITTTQLNANKFTLECGKGLRVNDGGTSNFSYTDIKRYITPASSINGRNLFFPTDGTDFSTDTKDMTFRSSTVGDKNVNYIQIDFTLTAQANNTALYINDNEEATYIRVKDHNGNPSSALAAPLRMAIWSSTAADGYPNTPVVFNPTSQTFTTSAVESVNSADGSVQNLGAQVSHTFSDYAYGGEPIATLSKGVETKFSVIIWLEGADPKSNKIRGKNIDMNLAFTTSWDKTKAIRFKDGTGSDESADWITDLMNKDHYSLTLHYVNNQGGESNGEITDFAMYPVNQNDANNCEWTCNMPGDMTKDITFVLSPPSSSSNKDTYIFCKNSKGSGYTYDRGVNRLYVATQSEDPATPSECLGYWMALGDSDGGGSDIGDIDGDDF
jgi:hypothetical protein